ncbi:NAD(P)-dependent oxidoreductase [Desulfogranum marinum]|uniref:NAD(P)-dependent oxidoreductase n=1 Tax=Desulfogranum marinum TaxID=453220 RepID=UPI0019656890|nr:NAD(P)-dependent oxidoreductase [Desulfogranum marinum]MBM9513610.1 NAD(P)-dependent oxidoreductase [Desulfogranum marinum]
MKLSKEKTTIGFVGIGVMGKSMAGHLLGTGYPLHIYTRTKKSADDLVAAGAVWAESVKALAEKCDVVFTMLGFPPDVEAVYFGEQGLLMNMKPGTYVVDMSTSRPDLAMKIFEAATSRKVHALDAPVSGGDIGARDARLSIMVGGDQETFDTVLPLFQLMGTNIVLQGSAGSGQHTKMCNQIAIAAGMMGVCEAFAYAEKAGLDPKNVLKSIESGAAGSWSLSNLVPRIIAGDFAPGFYVKHFIKDMAIAIEAADSMGLDVPGLKLAKSLYVKLAEAGGEDYGTQALYKLYSSK